MPNSDRDGSHERRLVDLEQLTHRLAGNMESVENQIHMVGGQLARIEQTILGITNKPLNITGWVGAALMFIGMQGASLAFLINYVTISNAPLEKQLETLEGARQRAQAFEERTNYSQGYTDAKIEGIDERLHNIDEYGSRRWVRPNGGRVRSHDHDDNDE